MADYSSTSFFTLVPHGFADSRAKEKILRDLFSLDQSYKVMSADVPQYGATLLYAWEKSSQGDIVPSEGIMPLILKQLTDLAAIREYNKLIMDFDLGRRKTTLLLAEGERLVLANSYHTVDLPSAIYYMLELLNKSQINPQQTTLHFSGKADEDQLKTLRSYVKDVRMRM